MSNTNESPQTIAFIGGGQMASALVAGLLRSGWNASSILVVEPAAEARERLARLHGVEALSKPDESLRSASVVIWAVKPQMLESVIGATLRHLDRPLHVSIAAGVPLAALSRWLLTERVVRAMPNTSATIGAGVTGLASGSGVSAEDRQVVNTVLGTAGHCFWVEGDAKIDAVTAISGSGPAYVFHFLEAFQKAAEDVGFDPQTARDLVLQTARGAVLQAGQGEAFALLREKVTSKRGTTAAALECLDQGGNSRILARAVQAARARAEELSAELAGNQQG